MLFRLKELILKIQLNFRSPSFQFTQNKKAKIKFSISLRITKYSYFALDT